MEVCQAKGYGIPTWGPSHKAKGLLATGTFAGSGEQQNLMRIFKYDVNNSAGLVLQGVTQSPAKFSSLDWIDFYPPSQDDYGIIAGGMDDGAITLWDPKKILDGQSTMETLKLGKGCVSATKIHSGVPVGSIEFNPHKKNLLASGGSEVLIQDIGANMKQPNVFKPGVPNYHEGARITSISWNRIVPHILASASENGKIVVWDLKVNKSIFNFTEPSSNSGGAQDYFGEQDQTQNQTMRETQMMWNPEIPTQFVVANDDDKNPTINIWDLRNPDYPVATFNDIHYSGILSFSWCLSDPSLVVSSGKDNRTVVTNFKTGEQVLEFPSDVPYKKIKWSNHLHGKICAMDDEGTTSIMSFEPEGLFSNPGRKFASPIVSQKTGVPFNPQWNQPKCGIRWGFGNKIVTFDQKSKGILRVHQKGTNADLAQKVQDFDNQLESLTKAQICEIMSKNAKNDYDMMEFKVLKCLIEDNYDDLLKLFGIDKNKAVFEVEKMLGRKLNRPQENLPQAPVKPIQNTMLQTSLPSMTAEGAADFFSQLGQKDQAKPPQAQPVPQVEVQNQVPETDNDGSIGSKGGKQNLVQETISRNTNWDTAAEGTIKKNLLIGKLEYAAQVALKSGRTTEALLIAEAGGPDLYEQIKADYFAQHQDPFVKEVIQAITKDDFSGIIEHVTSQQQIGPQFCNWKETLAYIIAYQDDAKLKEVAKLLGDQLLEKKKDINSAIVCYILSHDLDIVTDLWKKRALYQIRKGMNKQEALFNLFQKTTLLQAAFKNAPANKDIDLILADYAEYLNADHLGYFAMKYMQGSSGTSNVVQNVSDRIYFSQPQLHSVFQRPQPGFVVDQVRPQANANAQRQQVNHTTPQGGQMRQNPAAQRGQPARPGPPQQMANNQPMAQAQRQVPTQGPPQQRQNIPNQQDQMRPRPQPVVQQPNMPPPQQYGQPQPNTGAPPTNDLHNIVPRQGGILDESLDSNFGYGESSKHQRQPGPPQNQPQQNRQRPQQTPKPQGPPAKVVPIGKKPGPMQSAPSGGPQQARPGPPIPPQMTRPALPNTPMPAQPSSVAPMSTGPPQAFNPAQIQQRPQQPPQGPPTQMHQGPPQKAHPSQGLRPPPIQRPAPMQSAPQNQGMPMQQPMPQAPMQNNQPPPNFASPAMRAQPSGPPPGRAPPKFAAPPMAMGQQPPMQNQPGSMPPQNMPPPMGQAPPMAPPPGGSGGPKPMSSGMGSQRPGNQPSAGPAVNVQELVTGIQNLFNIYIQIETNQKAKGETEAKYNIMMQKIQGGQLQEMTMQKLQVFVNQVQGGNAQAAGAAFRDVTQRCWADVKDFSNALKALQKCQQR